VEERVRALFRPFASALTSAAALLAVSPTAASAAFAPGSAVEGHVGSTWSPCTTVGAQQRFGGYVLHCASLPDDNIFSETDVRSVGPARAAPQDPPTAPPRAVQGNVFGTWETCTTVGAPQPFGGLVLHCPSLPDDNVFSATDVREIGAAQPAPKDAPAAAAPGRAVQGYVFGVWENCTTVGPPQRFGGQVLHCPSLPDDNVFSATDVREIGVAPFAPPDQTAQDAHFTPPVPMAPAGRQVQGNVFGVWETCTLLGAQQGTGGYLLHCPSLPDDNVFSDSDVRL
jgi:hypothetical protein